MTQGDIRAKLGKFSDKSDYVLSGKLINKLIDVICETNPIGDATNDTGISGTEIISEGFPFIGFAPDGIGSDDVVFGQSTKTFASKITNSDGNAPDKIEKFDLQVEDNGDDINILNISSGNTTYTDDQILIGVGVDNPGSIGIYPAGATMHFVNVMNPDDEGDGNPTCDLSYLALEFDDATGDVATLGAAQLEFDDATGDVAILSAYYLEISLGSSSSRLDYNSLAIGSAEGASFSADAFSDGAGMWVSSSSGSYFDLEIDSGETSILMVDETGSQIVLDASLAKLLILTSDGNGIVLDTAALGDKTASFFPITIGGTSYKILGCIA